MSLKLCIDRCATVVYFQNNRYTKEMESHEDHARYLYTLAAKDSLLSAGGDGDGAENVCTPVTPNVPVTVSFAETFKYIHVHCISV
jgi:hypothetical protein